jgi:type I restriction enzyme S subunit
LYDRTVSHSKSEFVVIDCVGVMEAVKADPPLDSGEPGRCAVWNRAESMNIQKALHRLRPKEPLNSAFFFYQIESSIKSGRLEDPMTGSTIKYLTGKMLRQAVLAVPALEEQNQIVSEIHRRFSVLDQVEATVSTSLARCGKLRQAILKRAFRG